MSTIIYTQVILIGPVSFISIFIGLVTNNHLRDCHLTSFHVQSVAVDRAQFRCNCNAAMPTITDICHHSTVIWLQRTAFITIQHNSKRFTPKVTNILLDKKWLKIWITWYRHESNSATSHGLCLTSRNHSRQNILVHIVNRPCEDIGIWEKKASN